MFRISGNTVGKAAFEIGPDEFVGVKLRRVSWEVKGLESRMLTKELSDKFGAVEWASVPEKDNDSSEMPAKVSEKLLDLLGSNVSVGVESGVEPQFLSPGRDRDGRDRRDFGPTSGHDNLGRSSSKSPGPLDVGDERESTLIQEYQVGSKPNGLFLYEATRETSNNELPVPCAPWLSSEVSGSSNPKNSSESINCRCNNSPGSVCESPARSALGSKDPSRSRLPRALSPKSESKFSFAGLTEGMDVPYWAGTLNPSVRACDRLDASAPRNLTKRRVSGLPSDTFGLVLKTGRLDAGAFRAFGDCPEVSSCPPRLPLLYRLDFVSIKF